MLIKLANLPGADALSEYAEIMGRKVKLRDQEPAPEIEIDPTRDTAGYRRIPIEPPIIIGKRAYTAHAYRASTNEYLLLYVDMD